MPPTKSKRTTARKTGAKVIDMPEGSVQEMPPGPPPGPPPQQDQPFSVDPQRLANKLQTKLNETSLQLALTEAAFDQSQEEVRSLRVQIEGLQARIAELEAEPEDEADDDDAQEA